eukprot:TRINITY_DN4911_c0_g1_i1.p2 TRINITY_DN4911_c0_g1~~TRINITY_DN4911_c0_g1_i1.p2  ORF type:complete len:181 (+),score=27.74 TRINITY_DN4911_c0_g1_i1:58-600(+)
MSSSSSCTSSTRSADVSSDNGSTCPHKTAPKRTAFTSDTERPCAHNHWTKQTKKRGKLVLRCDICQCVWKTRPEAHTKCAAFHAGRCDRGDRCPHPHIYARREVRRGTRHGYYGRTAAPMGYYYSHNALPPATINPVKAPVVNRVPIASYVTAPPVIVPCHQQEHTYQRRQTYTHDPYAV